MNFASCHHAALCHWLPSTKRHPHQYRIPAEALRDAERALQLIADRMRRCKSFESLHGEVARAIEPIRKIGDLAIYDITHRIGAYLGKSPCLVYLHRGTAVGARHLGFGGATLEPGLLPPAFSKLSAAEIEDCLCIFKRELDGIPTRSVRYHRCGSSVTRRPPCAHGNKMRRATCEGRPTQRTQSDLAICSKTALSG
jgi:hypothetical protein